MLYSLDELVPLNRAYELAESFPGLVLIGSDGGGEAVGLDFRQSPPQVVLVNFVSAGWHEAVAQADTDLGATKFRRRRPTIDLGRLSSEDWASMSSRG